MTVPSCARVDPKSYESVRKPTEVAGHQIVWRRRYGVGGGSERADAFVQMRDLKAAQQHRVVRDVEPAIALQAGIGLVQARKLAISRRLRIQLQIDAVPPP
jgi:hypothetical protein